MYGYIYETTCLINGKKYIGQHAGKKFDEKYIGSGKYLWNAIRKYGIENFSCKLIEECNSREELDTREIFWISYFNAVKSEQYYNLASGGEGVRKNSKLSLETRLKMSKSQKGHPHRGGGCYQKGYKHTEQCKIQMSLNHADVSGENNPMYGKSAIKGRKWIRKIGEHRKYIKIEELEQYLNDGWELGM